MAELQVVTSLLILRLMQVHQTCLMINFDCIILCMYLMIHAAIMARLLSCVLLKLVTTR